VVVDAEGTKGAVVDAVVDAKGTKGAVVDAKDAVGGVE
jgi:hypothetical protein